MALLELIDVHTFYGNIQALKGISISVDQGEIVTLIGANGAGKTTTLMSICGITPIRSGEIRLNGKDISRLPPHKIVQMGVVQVPEGRRIFPQLTVSENLDMGAFLRRDKIAIKRDMEEVFRLFPRPLQSEEISLAARSQVVSSRCSLFRAHSWLIRTFYCSMSLRLALPPSSVQNIL